MVSLSESSIGTTKKLSSEVSTTIELQNIRTTSDSTGTLLTQNIARYMPLLSDVVVVFELNRSINSKWAIFGLRH
jgi:hypothetical protein